MFFLTSVGYATAKSQLNIFFLMFYVLIVKKKVDLTILFFIRALDYIN